MRRFVLIPGFAVLGVAWLGPLPALATQAFMAHMAMHVSVVAVAAPLIAIGLAGSRRDPVRRWPALFAPLVASVLEFAVIWGWHAPALHHAAQQLPVARIAEQASFLLVGLALWLSALGGAPDLRAARAGAGIAAMLATSMHMTLLGTLIALAPRPLYAHAGFAGLDPLEDQHFGGLIMLFGGGLAYLIGGLWLLAGLLRPQAGGPIHRKRAPERI
ncbi:cytochrome c oxidase assembly protein [soil metagenome]